MSESRQMLQQKAGELETVVDEVQVELSRADATRRSEAHARLAELTREARTWLSRLDNDADGEAAAAEVRRAETLLHDIRRLRGEI